jgi:cellulose synthase/poly-beta-1,6-N-acetylglucosamine synthase-like glycosyltransferase
VSRATIVVPTRDRPDTLARCLAALDGLVNRDEIEVLVVDDGSADEARVAAVVGAHPDVRLLRAPGRGLGAARNAGAQAAATPLLLFTDDDCRPDPRWALLLIEALAEADVAAGGATEPGDGSNAYAHASEEICAFARDRHGFLVGNNFACRREPLLAVPFDETSPVPAAEDREWSMRLVAAGTRLRHEPRALVLHDRPLDLRRFWAQHVRYGRGAAWLARTAPASRSWRFYPALIAAGFRRGVGHGALVCVAQIATIAGFVAERLGLHSR